MDKAHRSAFTYGRDNAAPALRSLCNLLKQIKQGNFCPDSTRSGRFKEALNRDAVARDAMSESGLTSPEFSGEPTVVGSEEDEEESSSLDSWTDSGSDADPEVEPEDGDLEEIDKLSSPQSGHAEPQAFTCQAWARHGDKEAQTVWHQAHHGSRGFQVFVRSAGSLRDTICAVIHRL